MKHQPATPLPWRWKRGAEGGQALHSGASDGAQTLVLLTVARRGRFSIAPKYGDTDYITHTAHAYPRLVDRMKDLLSAADDLAKGIEARRHARALLRELGEE